MLKAADPFVLHLQYASRNTRIVLIIVTPKDVMGGKLIDYVLHDLCGHLQGEMKTQLVKYLILHTYI